MIFGKLCLEYGNASKVLNEGLLENIVYALVKNDISPIRREILLLLSNIACEEKVSATRIADSDVFNIVLCIANNLASDLSERLESMYVVCNVVTTAEPYIVTNNYPQILKTVLRNLPAMKNNKRVLIVMLETILVLIKIMDQGKVIQDFEEIEGT